MSSPARPAAAPLSATASLRGLVPAGLLIVAMAVNFLWASGHDEQRCVELVLLAALGVSMLAGRGLADQLAALSLPARCCLGGLFFLGVMSGIGAYSPRHAAYEWSILLLLLLAAALAGGGIARTGASGLQLLLRGVLAIGLLHLFRMALLYAAALATGVQASMHDLAVGFSNVRFLNHTQTVLLPLMVLLFLREQKGSAWRAAAATLASCWWAVLYMSEARASLLALLTGCVCACALRRGQAIPFLKAMVLTALAGVAVYLLAFVLLPVLAGLAPFSAASNIVQRTAADPTSARNLLWQLALRLIADHPWLGIGPHHFAHEGARLSWGAHPHDFLLQIGAEWGLPALSCLLGAIGLGVRGLVRCGARIAPADEAGQHILAALLAGGAAMGVDGLLSGVIVMPQSQLAIVLYLACAAGWVRSLEAAAAPRAGPAWRGLAAALAAAALFTLACAVAPSLVAHARHDPLTPAEQAANPSIQWPRLWEAGYF